MVFKIRISIAQICMWIRSNVLYIKYYAYLTTYLARQYYLYDNCDITFLTVFILTHPVNFPCGRKPEHPEKIHDV
jgi:hypothetical protein